MISREDTLEVLGKYSDSDVANVVVIKEIVNVIYDSIGTCIDCKYGEKTMVNAEFIYCHKLEIEKDDTFFCADFKRKL